MEPTEKFQLVVDVKLRQPACVLLQAAYGCTGYPQVMRFMPEEAWLTFPTDDMRLVEGTREEWEKFGKELTERFPRPRLGVRRKR